jgi:hypothetical protein
MTMRRVLLSVLLALVFSASFLLRAQQPPAAPAGGQGQRGGAAPARGGPNPQAMTFFVSSEPIGDGGNLGGLAGADAHCQKLAAAAGSTRNWHAYLSTQGANAVNARDRIGNGPFVNIRGNTVAASVAQLHGDSAEDARLFPNINKSTAFTEKNELKKGFGDTPNEHDILTGTQPDGRAYTDSADHTCSNWTSNASTGRAQLGHFDRTGGPNASWNSVHGSRGCAQADLVPTGGIGLLYCFAVN